MNRIRKNLSKIISFALVISLILPIAAIWQSKTIMAAENAGNEEKANYLSGEYGGVQTTAEGDLYLLLGGLRCAVSEDLDISKINEMLATETDKTILCKFNNGLVVDVYTPRQIMLPRIELETNPRELIYQNGKMNMTEFEVSVKVVNLINGKYDDIPQSVVENMGVTINKIKIEPSGKGLNFGSSGFGWFENKQTTTEITPNEFVKCGDSITYTKKVYVDKDYSLMAPNSVLLLNCTVESNLGSDTTQATISVGNLDYQSEKAAEKKASTYHGTTVDTAKTILNNNSGTKISWGADLDSYLSSAQTEDLKKYLYAWFGNIVSSIEFSDKNNYLQKKVCKKLKIDTSSIANQEDIIVSTDVIVNSKKGKRTIEFSVNAGAWGFKKGNVFAGFGQINYSVYDAGGKKEISGSGAITYTDMESFTDSLYEIASDSIKNAYMKFWGNDANKVADYLVEGTFIETLCESGVLKGTFADNVYKYMEKGVKRSVRTSIKCPVDVQVYDRNGKLCGEITNNQVNPAYNEVYLYTVGDEKYVYLTDDSYYLKLTGTGGGTMEYDMEECDSNGNVLRTIRYCNVPLTEGSAYYAPVPEAGYLPGSLYDLVDESGNSISATKDDREISGATMPGQVDYKATVNDEGYLYFGDNTEGYFSFDRDEDKKEITLSEYKGVAKSVVIPAMAILDGDVYNINMLGSWFFVDRDDSLQSVSFVKVNGRKIEVKDNTLNSCFFHCINLISVDMDGLNMSNVTDMSGMFSWCSRLVSLDIGDWDVGNVTDISEMFWLCGSLKSLDIGDWDVGNVTDMSSLFKSCSNLTNMDIGNWNVGNVTNMSEMFCNCGLMNLNIENWNVGNVTNMSKMFWSCDNLASLDIGNWDVGNVTSMSGMFDTCSSLTSLNIGNWDVRNVTSMHHMFDTCSSLTSLNIENWNVGNVTDMSSLFKSCSNLTNMDIGNWNVGNVTCMEYMFSNCRILTSLNIENWDVGNVTNMDRMFAECRSLVSLNIGNWNVGNVTDMWRIFEECDSLTSLDIGNWDVRNVKYMREMFYGCGNLTILDIGNWELRSIISMDIPVYCDCFISPKFIAGKIVLECDYLDADGNEYTSVDTSIPIQTLLRRKYSIMTFDDYYHDSLQIDNLDNPDSYTSVTETFTLNNPKKDGYIFLGWTGSNGYTPQTKVTIVKGTKGNLRFTANWQKIDDSVVNSTTKPSYAPVVSATNRPHPLASSIPIIPRPSASVSTTVPSSSPGSTMQSVSAGKSKELVKGESITDGKTKAVYKITKAGSEVEYVKISNKATSKITIPATITISGKTYKVVAIKDNAFNGCTKLKTAVIEKNVVKIGKQAFYGCKNLKKITVKTSKLKTVGSNAIKGIYKRAVIKVPKNTQKKYKKLFSSKTGFNNQMKIK